MYTLKEQKTNENKQIVCITDKLLQISVLYISVADPDPDPVGSGLFWSPGSGSGKIPDPDPLSTKRPHVIQIFSYKTV